MKITLLSVSILVLFLSACSNEKKTAKSSVLGMKCGSGKCGANMFDGSAALVKKKKNILAQMRGDDSRQNCVKTAKTTKETYDCVRDPKTGVMSLKCGGKVMKCGAGKCGGSMK